MSAATERALKRAASGQSIRSSAIAEGVDPSTLFRAIRRRKDSGTEVADAPLRTRVVIAGAGALGRELLGWFRHDGQINEVVFIDDLQIIAGEGPAYAQSPVVASIDTYAPQDHDIVLIAAADPRVRADIADRVQRRGVNELPVYVHRSVIRADSCAVGAGSLLLPRSLVSADAALGRLVTVNTFCSIGHDVVLGDCCTLSSHVDLCGRVRAGARVFFGSGARVLPGVQIGDDAVIGAGSVVVRDVPAGATVFGNPARIIA